MRRTRFVCLLTLVVGLSAITVPAIDGGVAAAPGPTPSWKILVLIYEHTDFSFADGALSRRVVADLTAEETAFAASEAAAFVGRDIPTLDSHQMRPSLEIRYPGTITDLESFCGWWPAPWRIAADLDPTFDSVIVIWDSTGTDVNSGQPYNLQDCAGLTLPNGTGQTFSTLQIDGFPPNRFRNTLKHEWGHSILFYYEAAGSAPTPSVDNHQPGAYVHCGTGEGYVLVDETQDQPIRNSIYNNRSGFTHDYYSGTTALASDPDACLGITRAAWASGGPVATVRGRAASPVDAAVRTPIHEHPRD